MLDGLGPGEFCARHGWSPAKYRKVAQRARARLRELMAAGNRLSRHAPAVGTADRDPACDRKRNNTHRRVPRGRRGSVAHTSHPATPVRATAAGGRRPPPAGLRPLARGPFAGATDGRAEGQALTPTCCFLPRSTCAGVGWEGAASRWAADRGRARLLPAAGVVLRWPRAERHLWVAVCIGGVGCTCGLLAALLQSHVAGSLPSRVSASPRVAYGACTAGRPRASGA